MTAIYSDDYVKKIINALKKEKTLSDCAVISAYPYAMKPARLTAPVLAVSPSKITAEKSAIGQSYYTGERSVSVEAFVPRQLGSPCAYNIIEAVVKTAAELGAASVTAGKIAVRNEIECFSAECVMSFFAEMKLTEENDG